MSDEPKRLSVAARLPANCEIGYRGDELRVSALIKTAHGLDALIEALRILRPTLSSRREAVPADFGVVETKRPFAELLTEWLG